jgi:ferredoxin
MVDHDCVLRRVLVDEKLIAAAHRCRETWHSLQELGGIRSSRADQLLARERKVWEEQKQREIEALKREARPAPGVPAPAAPAPAAQAAPKAAPAAVEAAEPEKSSDEAYIETPRCTTCNECTNLNNRLFAYDANKQAYIADINAGTYRELVEAAESCQVSIIHPGKPRNPNEPGIADLLKRAEPFL